jgi:ornithine decarboxylase
MPKFVLSKSKVLERFDFVSQMCDMVSYSSKTNPLVTEILDEERKCMFSIHLKNELVNVREKEKVFFLAQGWTKAEVEELVSMGVEWFCVDNDRDLEVFMDVAKGCGKKLNLFLRLKLREHSLKTERYFVFGFSSDRVNKLVKSLSSNDAIGNLGVHFHRKTQNMAEWNLVSEISSVLSEECLQSLDYVNIGGGLPSEYANTNVKVVDTVVKKIGEFREWLVSKKVKMVIEPGRFICAPAVKLVCKVLRVYDNNIVVDASVYNSDMDALIVPVKLLVEGEGKGEAYVIKGVTPCSMDLFRYRVYLPEVKEGSEIVFLNAGAYNFSTSFCDLGEIETEIVS